MSSVPILSITREIHDVLAPVTKTTLKYQCIGVCQEFICLGATSGSTYVFSRNNGKLVKFFGHKVNAIVALKFSHDEKLLAIADSSGTVICWEVDAGKKEFKIAKEIGDFHGSLITAMCWNESSTRLFVGSKQGLVMAFHVGVVAFYVSETIRKAGEPIIQMDCSQDRLIISSTTKAIVCFLDRSQFHQIGTKPRDGQYGVCFMKNRSNGSTFIYSARPGSRLWEVDFSGQVLATHQFKEALKFPPTPIITSRDVSLPESDTLWDQPQSFNFPHLIPVMEHYILTWSPRGIYFIDPTIRAVVLWNDQIKDIAGISCSKDSVYILHFDGSVSEIFLFTIKECLLEFRKLEEWLQLAKVACTHAGEILENVESYLSVGFYEVLLKLKENEPTEEHEVVEKFDHFIQEVDARYAVIRTMVQEKMSQIIMNNADPLNASDQSMDDSDEIRSTVSDGGISETSSMISLSRLSEVKDTLMQKVTGAVVSKVIHSGFMKRAFRDALQSEGVILDMGDTQQTKQEQHLNLQQTQNVPLISLSVPTSPRQLRRHSLERCSSELTLPQFEMPTPSDKNLSSGEQLQRKTISSPVLSSVDGNEDKFPIWNAVVQKDEEIVVQRKKTKRKKKAKVIKLENTEAQTSMADDAVNNKPVHELEKHSIDLTITNPSSPKAEPNEKALQEFSANKSKAISTPRNHIDLMSHVPLMLEPPINTSMIVNTLVNTTFSTRNDIRDAKILYNPANFLEKLKRWSHCLAKVTAEFREECFRGLDSRIQCKMTNNILAYLEIQCNNLFFKQFHSAFSEICNVAMLCLETNSFPETFSSMKSYEIALLNIEDTLDDIMERAYDSVQKIMLLEDKVEAAFPDPGVTKNLTEESHSEGICQSTKVSEDVSESSPEKPSQSTESSNNDFRERNFADLFNKDLREILFDKQSLKTINPEPSTYSSVGSVIDSIDVLFDNPLLCENLNICEGEPCHQCAVDKCRACFVLRYFSLVNVARIRTLFSLSNKCRWRTWLACVVRLKYSHRSAELMKMLENTNTSDSVLLNEIKETDVKIVLANSLEINNRSPALMLECTSVKNLPLWEMTLLYFTGILGKPSSNVDNFLSYVNEAIDVESLDTLSLNCVIDSALQNHQGKKLLFCSTCRQARPGSSCVHWRWDSLLKKLVANQLNRPKSTKNDQMLLRFSNACWNFGYWYGYLHLVNKFSIDNKDIIHLLCQLDDYELLSSLTDENDIMFSEEDWLLLLHEYTEMHSNNNEHQCPPINDWLPSMCTEKVVKLIAIHVGPRYALNCLKDVLKKSTESYHGVYTSLLQALELENKQESIVCKLVEVASANVWSKARSLIPHKFEVIKEAELRHAEFITPSAQQDRTEAVWGRSISISSAECSVCTLPLCLKSSHTSITAALIVFQCGHSFHKICVPENACLVCYYNNFETLF